VEVTAIGQPPTRGAGQTGTAQIQHALVIDTTEDVHRISPYVYGSNQPDWGRDTGVVTLMRAGGNRWTAYNGETNASDAGSDYLHQNDDYHGGGSTPGGAIRERVEPAHAAGAAALVTVPIAGYVAADKDGGGDVAASPDYLNTRFFVSRPGESTGTVPDTSDRVVYQDQMVRWIEQELAPGGEVFSPDSSPIRETLPLPRRPPRSRHPDGGGLMRRATAIGLIVLATACGGSTTEEEGTVDTTTGGETDATNIAWADMTPEQRGAYMRDTVVPTMAPLFQAVDAERYAEFDCRTCHGENARDVHFQMPNGVHPLNPTDIPAVFQSDEPMDQLMTQSVWPRMAELLGEEQFDPETGAGFSCMNCHATADAPGE